MCLAEAEEYNKQRYEKTHMKPEFQNEDQVLVSILSFSKLKGPKKMRYSFVGPFTIIKLIGKNEVETGEDKFTSRNKIHTLKDIVELEDSPGPEKKIFKASNIRLNGKNQRQYLVRFKNQTGDKDKWLTEDAMPYRNLNLRGFGASRSTEQSHQ
ncbi:hypothetical protein O181_006562 [Austropuccinia psidii MF-1]|uniref:Uncharacterized protein n=1 Tax=Austropuccinia psidii MF-1 TaxID=1389203 RepID=A0A9Q3BL15_9BASI|nr:hypothetical protein [Austropuccinia psidii MF-1]